MRLRVLVVDDNVELAENIAELLQDLDDQLDVVFSRGTRGAMDIAVRSGFDIALVDIRLAEGDDGLALLPKLRELCPGGEVILMTGHGTLDSAITALRQGAFAYVLKPFDAQDFLELGGRALAHVRLRNERQRLSEELERSEALHRAIVEHTEALLVGIGPAGEVAFAGPHALRALRLPGDARAAVVGESFLTHFAEDAQGTLGQALGRALAGERAHDVDAPLLRKHGAAGTVRWTLAPVPSAAHEDQARVAVMAVGVDVTDQLDAERAAREAESLAAMGRLTAGLAHEIRNPLNGALLQLELLVRANGRAAESASKEVVRETSGVIKRELRGLADLLDEFLEMARAPVPRLEAVDVVALIADLMGAQAPVADAMAVTCSYTGPDSVEVMAEPAKLRQALLNLFKNALEAMSAGGSLRFEVVPEAPEQANEAGARVEVRVADDGPGLDSEMLREAFRPFKTSKHAGTGLGLAIVARTIHACGGAVTIENRPEGGALVRVRLLPAPLPSDA